MFLWYKNVGRIFFRFVTVHAFNGETDRRLFRGYTVRYITCSRTVKIEGLPARSR